MPAPPIGTRCVNDAPVIRNPFVLRTELTTSSSVWFDMKLKNAVLTLALGCALASGSAMAFDEGGPDLTFAGNGQRSIAFDIGGQLTDISPVAKIDGNNGMIQIYAQISTTVGNKIGYARLQPNGTTDPLSFHEVLPLGDRGGTFNYPRVTRVTDNSIGLTFLLTRLDISLNDSDFLVCRLFYAGNADPSFGDNGCRKIPFDLNGVSRDFSQSIAIDSQGRIVVAGFGEAATGMQPVFARLNPNGTLDNSFSFNGKQNLQLALVDSARVFAIKILDDDRIAFVGDAKSTGKNNNDVLIGRLLENGELDTSYFLSGTRRIAIDLDGAAASTSDDQATAMALDKRTGAITVAGYARTGARSSGLLARFLPNGALDSSYSSDGQLVVGFPLNAAGGAFTDIQIDSAGRVYGFGSAQETPNDQDFVLFRSTATGGTPLDFNGNNRIYRNFGPAGRQNLTTQMLLQDGKPLLFGYSQISGLDYDLTVTRLNVDLIFANGAQ